MIGPLLYLRVTSLRNLVVYRFRRLRQPKYLFGTAVALAYLYFIKSRTGMGSAVLAAQGGAGREGSMIGPAFICAGVCLVALVRIAFAWISPAEKAGLRFSEAEIAFLFPAPLSRKSLIHYRLLSTQFAILFTSVLIVVFFNRGGYLGDNRFMRAVGWWIILSTFDLHINGTNLSLSQLRNACSRFLLLRTAVVAGILLYAGAIFWSAAGPVRRYLEAGPTLQAAPNAFVVDLLDSPVFHWLTLPFRIVLGPYFASSWPEFALAMAPALLLLGLHYWWVSRSEARFEEGSIAMAERRAAQRAAMKGGGSSNGLSKPKSHKGPFPLSPVGPPEIAFLWKNLLSMRSSMFSRRTLFIALVILFWLSVVLGPLLTGHARSSGSNVAGPMIVAVCGMIAGYTLLLGPQIARQDLRNDLQNADLLKTYPLEAWRLALGELLAPTVLLTLILWVTIAAAAAAVDPLGTLTWLTPAVRVTVSVGLGLVAPLLCLIQLVVPNSIMVLFPGWAQASRSRAAGGIELFGQRLIFGVVQILFVLFVVLHTAGTAAAVFAASWWLLGTAGGVALATLAVLAILVTEAAIGLWFLGQRFEKFDVSTEFK